MFRTELPVRPDAQLLSLGARVLTIGSCFSDVIGERLAGHKVRTLVNPFGTVFNPLAAARLLRAVAGEDTDWQQHVVEARGRWQSYDLHASIGADSPPALLQRIEQTVQDTAAFVRSADVLIWTLGTAFGYRLRDTGEVVNNCHKLPAERFEKELLTAEEIVTAVTEAYALLRQINSKLRLILTVSPVRHLRDTLPLNAVSKSVLRVACHYLSELLPGASYFPAYELLLDDLRDYRFYAADMIHPSDVAEQYVWEKFTSAYFDQAFRQFVQEWQSIQRSLNHRPLHDGAPEHREFLEQTQQRLERIAGRVDVRSELRDVHKRIVALPPPPKPVLPPEPEDDEERIDIGEEASSGDSAQTKTPPAPARPAYIPRTERVPAPAQEPVVEPEPDEVEEDLLDYISAENEDSDAESVVEADAAQPKRRKRKRGGRKHKRKGNRIPEEQPLAVVETGVTEQVSASEVVAETPQANEQPAEATPSVGVPAAEQTAADAPTINPTKRRGRPARKQPALYAEPPTPEQPISAEAAPVAEVQAAVPAEPTPAPAESVVPTSESQPRRGRSGRGGRKTPKLTAAVEAAVEALPVPEPVAPVSVAQTTPALADVPAEPAPRRRPAPRRKPAAAAPTASESAAVSTPDVTSAVQAADAAAPAPRRGRPPRRPKNEPPANS